MSTFISAFLAVVTEQGRLTRAWPAWGWALTTRRPRVEESVRKLFICSTLLPPKIRDFPRSQEESQKAIARDIK